MASKADKILIAALCILALIGIGYELFFMKSDNVQLELSVAGKKQQLDLRTDRILPVVAEYGNLNIEIKQGKVRVIDVDCPDHTCEKMGWISVAPQKIVCVPNKVIISLVADTAVVDTVIQ